MIPHQSPGRGSINKKGWTVQGEPEPIPRDTARVSNIVPKKASDWLRHISCTTAWHQLLVKLLLAAITISISIGFADTTIDRILLPIEVLGADGATVSRSVKLASGQAESVRSLWLQIH